jgi:type III restriction enzyme
MKRILVASVRSDDNFNDAYVKLRKTDNTNGIKAQIEFHEEGTSGPKAVKRWAKQGNDLFVLSKEREARRRRRTGRAGRHLWFCSKPGARVQF